MTSSLEQTETTAKYRFSGPFNLAKDPRTRTKGVMRAERLRKREEAEKRDRELPQDSPLRKKNKPLDLTV